MRRGLAPYHRGMIAPRKISALVIHCAAVPNGRYTRVEDVDHWHKERGFKRQPEWLARQNPGLTAIGYHFFIYTGGTVATGRHVDEIGAHAQGYNAKTLAICMAGTDQYSVEQWQSLAALVTGQIARLTGQNGPGDRRGGLGIGAPAVAAAERAGIRIIGHRDLPGVSKTCPGFSVADWLQGGMQPLAGHVFTPQPPKK